MEIKNIYGAVIYSDESATIKETLENAVKKGARLDGAILDGASLVGAILDGAILDGASLDGAILDGASLVGARLVGTSLDGASLVGAIKIPISCKWLHGITDGLIHIGCEKRSIEDWKIFLNSNEKIETERDTQEFKQIKAVISAYIAYLEVLNG